MEDDPVVVVVAGQEDEVVDGLRRADVVEGDGHGALGGHHLGRVALGRVDDHRGRPVESLGLRARAVGGGDVRGHGLSYSYCAHCGVLPVSLRRVAGPGLPLPQRRRRPAGWLPVGRADQLAVTVTDRCGAAWAGCRRCWWRLAVGVDLVDDVHARGDLAEQGVVRCQALTLGPGHDEELAAVGARVGRGRLSELAMATEPSGYWGVAVAGPALGELCSPVRRCRSRWGRRSGP